MRVHPQRKVTIVGGGVAGLEALLALRSLTAGSVELELVADTPHFTYRPLAVAEPFGAGVAHRFDLTRIARDQRARLHIAGMASVDPEAKRITTWDGRSLGYDLLLVAIGAQAGTAVPGSVSIKGPAYTSRFRTLLRDVDRHRIRRIAFAVPSATSWPLPLYELALLTAAHVADRGLRKVSLQLVTHESEPLELFGPPAARMVRAMLDERGVELVTNRVPVEFAGGELRTALGSPLAADRVVSLPKLSGPGIEGLPADAEGFVPVDLHGRVHGVEDVYAAGDATTSPVKQGGIAAQQADAAAEAIAAQLGLVDDPRPFRPVLRGLLLTGGAPRYLRGALAGGSGDDLQASDGALWWPPSKVAGRYISPYLAAHVDELAAPPEGLGVEVPLETGAAALNA